MDLKELDQVSTCVLIKVKDQQMHEQHAAIQCFSHTMILLSTKMFMFCSSANQCAVHAIII